MGKPPIVERLSSTALWAIVGALFAVSYHLHSVRDAIRQSNSFYLCIELAKAGGDSPICDKLLSEETKP